MKKLIALFALIGAISAQAQETPFYTSTESNIYRVGQTTRSFNNGPVMTTWMKLVSKYQDKYSLDLVQVHCPTGMYQVLKHTEYVNGGYLKSSNENPTGWVYATPGTLGDSLKYLCQ